MRVNKTGICGTDIHIFSWDAWAQKTVPVPMVVGHEFAGEIVEIGSAVNASRWRACVGRRACHRPPSRATRPGKFHLDPDTRGIGVNIPGAFAEYVRVPAFNIVPLPEEVDDELGAILDLLGNAVHTALSFDLVGEDVLITGAGPIGIMSAAIARHVGARHVVLTDVNPTRLALAASIADCTARRRVEGRPEGRDEPPQDAGGLRCRPGDERLGSRLQPDRRQPSHGRQDRAAGAAGKPLAGDWWRIVLKALTMKGIYGREMFETWHKGLAILQSGLNVAASSPTAFRHADVYKASSSWIAWAPAARSSWTGRAPRALSIGMELVWLLLLPGRPFVDPIWVFLERARFAAKTLDFGVGFLWISLDLLVRIETYQWVTRDLRRRFFFLVLLSRERAVETAVRRLGMRRGWNAHGAP